MAYMKEDVLYDIFLDTQKAYDALDRGVYLNILVIYGVGTGEIFLLIK